MKHIDVNFTEEQQAQYYVWLYSNKLFGKKNIASNVASFEKTAS